MTGDCKTPNLLNLVIFCIHPFQVLKIPRNGKIHVNWVKTQARVRHSRQLGETLEPAWRVRHSSQLGEL